MAATIFLADTSIWVLRGRHSTVERRFDELLIAGRLAACQVTSLETLNNAPDPKTYTKLWDRLATQRWIDVTTQSMNRAMEVHKELSRRSQHRNFRLMDLIIAATAELNGATVLHYDADFDRIANVTNQPTEWVVPRGSLAPPH